MHACFVDVPPTFGQVTHLINLGGVLTQPS